MINDSNRHPPKAGYHPSHKKEDEKNELKKQGFYKWPAWRRIRLLALQRDHYLCQLRLSKNCTRIATEVHHIKSIAEYPELALDLDNLTSSCWNCHELTKPRRSQQPTPKGVRIIRIGDGSETNNE